MAYIPDSDLEFLQHIKSKDLDDLVRHLTHGNAETERITEELTMSEAYKKYFPDHNKYWQEIAAEIQCFGANSIATLFRGGKGVSYREVLTDVCKKLKIKYDANASTEDIEGKLLTKVFEDVISKMSSAEIASIAKELKISGAISPLSIGKAVALIFKQGGFQSYQYSVIVANIISKAVLGRGLSFAANAALTAGLSKVIGFATGPVGNAILLLLNASTPAFRVTFPAVVFVATLRRKYEYEKSKKGFLGFFK